MSDDGAPDPGPAELPPGLDLLWGRRARGKRGPKAELSVDAIVGAAMALADGEGLEAVSMAKVAQALGYTTMSLYRHVANKDELLQLMWNASAVGAEGLVLAGDDWRSRIRCWAIVQRDMLDRHPWITQMPMATPPVAPNSLHFVERGLAALDGTGLDDGEKLRVIGLLSSYTLSEARMARDAARAGRGAEGSAPPLSFEAVLRLVVDRDTYPRLYGIAWGAPEVVPDERAEFLAGVECILDGVEYRVERARNAGTSRA